MPHFHFDVCTNGVIVEDEDGLDLLNAATARLEAVRVAAEMMKDRCADTHCDGNLSTLRHRSSARGARA